MGKIRFVIVGAGSRGNAYADSIAEYGDRAEVVAVAEPRQEWRQRFAEKNGLAPENCFSCWKDLAAMERNADVAVIATQDRMHLEPLRAFAEKGYHILLEKPMAVTPDECKEIVGCINRAGVLFGVCHVLRYTPYTRRLKELLAQGVIGDVVSIQHLEPVGFWHYAHSYVRGNWRRQDQSSFMLLAKSCHDLDWLRYIADSSCMQISSMGSLKHFRAECRPEGAADRCLDCRIEKNCPYSAKKIYLAKAEAGDWQWPVNVLVMEENLMALEQVLREGPYGRCVYACDNDMVDHQVVNMEFDNGVTASFVMTAFSEMTDRRTRIFGTRGELYGNGNVITCYDFLSGETRRWVVNDSDGSILTNHGGGDQALIRSFIDAVAEGDESRILSGPAETLESHLMVFAAEKARLERRTVQMSEEL